MTDWVEPTDEERALLGSIAFDDFAWFDRRDCDVRLRATVPNEYLLCNEHLVDCGLTIVVRIKKNELTKAFDLHGPWVRVTR